MVRPVRAWVCALPLALALAAAVPATGAPGSPSAGRAAIPDLAGTPETPLRPPIQDVGSVDVALVYLGVLLVLITVLLRKAEGSPR